MIDLERFIIDRITQFRLKMRLTQKDLGKIINTSPSFIGSIENPRSESKYNLRHIVALAEYFKLKPVYFFLSDSEYQKIDTETDLKKLSSNFPYARN